jgi:hypothetical protein
VYVYVCVCGWEECVFVVVASLFLCLESRRAAERRGSAIRTEKERKEERKQPVLCFGEGGMGGKSIGRD